MDISFSDGQNFDFYTLLSILFQGGFLWSEFKKNILKHGFQNWKTLLTSFVLCGLLLQLRRGGEKLKVAPSSPPVLVLHHAVQY